MAVTGYEVDVVRKLPHGGIVSVPCTEQYNHHYSGFMHSKSTQATYPLGQHGEPLATDGHGAPLPFWEKLQEPTFAGVPTVQSFSEGNGNEHRRSFKGYPSGYAQLIESPVSWANGPMMINTNKRLTGETTPGPIASLLPKNSLAPPNATYSGMW